MVVQRVGELVRGVGEVAPQRVGPRVKLQLLPLPLAVADEGAVLAAVDVVVDGQQVLVVELEGLGKLLQ